MIRTHAAMPFIRELLRKEAPKAAAPAPDEAHLDSVAQAAKDEDPAALAAHDEQENKTLDGTKADSEKDEDQGHHILDDAGTYSVTDIALKAAAAVQEWAETSSSDLSEGEGLGDRLFALLAGIADEDMDGEISEDEADIINLAADQAVDYLVGKGVPEDDAVAFLTDFDNTLADSIQELVAAKLPDGDEAAAEDLDAFVFGDGSDDAVLDATYKKKIAVRLGKKVRINKRVSGTVRLSAAQKVAVKKMLRKSHSAKAQMRRSKSVKVRKQMGI